MFSAVCNRLQRQYCTFIGDDQKCFFFKFPFFAIPVYNTDSYSHFRAIYMRFTILLESRISMVIFMYMYSLISENRG